MRGRKGGKAPPTDLLVCFPSRTHLALMPKPVSSPSRSGFESSAIIKRRSSSQAQAGSPSLWAKNSSRCMEAETDQEPTSPKVTCAGQIKVRSKPGRNWQSVMEEIERLRHDRKAKRKKPTWVEALGLKKDVTQFLSCLRGLRLDLRCFGSFHQSVLSSDDDDDDDEEDDDDEDKDKDHADREQVSGVVGCDTDDGDGSVFSKWFMVLEENHNPSNYKDAHGEEEDKDDQDESLPCAPPPNALLLMRCRSAPAKTWLEEKQEQEEEAAKKEECALDETNNKDDERESVVFKYYAPDFFKVSSDIAKETWVVGGARDPLSRSRSWKR